MNTNVSNTERFGVTLAKSLALSYIVTLIFFIIFALILTYTSLSEGAIPIINSIIMIISIAIGSIRMAIKSQNKGWLNGALVGVLYVLVLVFLSSIFVENFEVNSYLMMKAIIGLITGAVGGMIGINVK